MELHTTIILSDTLRDISYLKCYIIFKFSLLSFDKTSDTIILTTSDAIDVQKTLGTLCITFLAPKWFLFLSYTANKPYTFPLLRTKYYFFYYQIFFYIDFIIFYVLFFFFIHLDSNYHKISYLIVDFFI